MRHRYLVTAKHQTSARKLLKLLLNVRKGVDIWI